MTDSETLLKPVELVAMATFFAEEEQRLESELNATEGHVTTQTSPRSRFSARLAMKSANNYRSSAPVGPGRGSWESRRSRKRNR